MLGATVALVWASGSMAGCSAQVEGVTRNRRQAGQERPLVLLDSAAVLLDWYRRPWVGDAVRDATLSRPWMGGRE